MKENYIQQFMWGYQRHFRLSTEVGVKLALEEVGFFGDPKIILVGIQVAGQHEFDICIESKDSEYSPDDLININTRGRELYEAHPDRNLIHSVAHVHEQRHRQLRNWMRAKAIEEAFSTMPEERGRSFFASGSVRVDDYAVHILLSVDQDALTQVPQITTEKRDRLRIHKSLIHSVIDEVLRLATRALYFPNPGSGLLVLDARSDEIVRNATEAMVSSAIYCAGSLNGSERHLLISNLSALPYEGRSGVGRIVIAQPANPAIDVIINLSHPTQINNALAVRKLLEVSGHEVDLLSDGEIVYGLGVVKDDYDISSETVFVISFTGRGVWELSHAGEALLIVRDGNPHLPIRVLDEEYFQDLIDRLFLNADHSALLEAARATGNHSHGAMLIISGDASNESNRLSPQSWAVEPVSLPATVLTQLTNMDGAVLLDPQGRCHAIGVILDGIAHGKGDPARGSRFNNAIRYLDSEPPPTIVVVYSADGGIDILPKLMPRIEKKLVDDAVRQFVAAALADPLDINRATTALEIVKRVRFYLSDVQCLEINKARLEVDKWRKANTSIWPVENNLVPSMEMNDSYWL